MFNRHLLLLNAYPSKSHIFPHRYHTAVDLFFRIYFPFVIHLNIHTKAFYSKYPHSFILIFCPTLYTIFFCFAKYHPNTCSSVSAIVKYSTKMK